MKRSSTLLSLAAAAVALGASTAAQAQAAGGSATTSPTDAGAATTPGPLGIPGTAQGPATPDSAGAAGGTGTGTPSSTAPSDAAAGTTGRDAGGTGGTSEGPGTAASPERPAGMGMGGSTEATDFSARERRRAEGAGSSAGNAGPAGPPPSRSGVGRDAAGSTAGGRGMFGGTGGGGMSWLPYTTRGYVGASLGRADLDQDCAGGFDCDDPDVSGKVFTGGMFNEWLGAELGWIHFGRAEGSGGRRRAHGLNLSLVGAIPVSPAFSVFAKLGTTYGWTRTSAAAATGVETGSENGFGLSGGVGASMDITPEWSVMLEWERHRLKFAGGRDSVDLTTLGLKYKF